MAYKIYVEKQGTPYPYDTKHYNGSLPELPEVSTKMKPIEEDNANAEIEKGEIILDPETGALHKALGKPHSKGGTPVSLKDGSFIFSNYKNLAIKKNEKELFEFKLGGKYKPQDNTPSKVLEKEVDLEHHNKMIDILQNEKKHTEETVNSAKLMMLKNLEKVGQLAFLQESKKNLQAPAFAQQTAPVYSKDTDEQINQSMQYLQQGGRKLTAEEILKAEKNKLNDITGWNFLYRDGRKSYYDKPGSVQTTRTKPSAADEAAYAKYLSTETAEQRMRRKAREAQQSTPGPLGYTADLLSNSQLDLKFPKMDSMSPAASLIGRPPTQQLNGNLAGNPQELVDPTTYDTKLTPWQKINVGIPFYRALNIKTQYPLRQHQESVIPQMENINAQPQLDQNNQAYFNAAQQTKGLIPGQASAYMQQLFGTRIAANNQAIGNVQNANVQTQNNQKIMTANTLNQDAVQNRAFDLKYYDQTQTAIKNTDELRQAYTQQGINNLNETMTKKLAFDSWLNTQQQYKGNPTYVDKDGIQHYQGQALYTPKPGFWGNSIQYNPANIDWSTYQSSTANRVDSAEELGQAYLQAKQFDETLKFADFLKFKGISNYNTKAASATPPTFKGGGKYRSKKSC